MYEFSLAAHNGFTLWLRYPHGALHNYIESFIDSVNNCPASKMLDEECLDLEALSQKECERIGGADWRICLINDDFQVRRLDTGVLKQLGLSNVSSPLPGPPEYFGLCG